MVFDIKELLKNRHFREWAVSLAIKSLVKIPASLGTVPGLDLSFWLLTLASCSCRHWEAVVRAPATHVGALVAFPSPSVGCAPCLFISGVWSVNWWMGTLSITLSRSQIGKFRTFFKKRMNNADNHYA